MGSSLSIQSENVPSRLQQFLNQQKTRIERTIRVPSEKEDVKTRIIENELGFTISVFQAYCTWAQAEKALVFWDIDNTLGFEVPNNLFFPKPGITELLKFLATEFPNIIHGILSYRPKIGIHSIECLFENDGGLHELREVFVYRVSARRFVIQSETDAIKPAIIGFKAPKEISDDLMELRDRGLTSDAILEKLGIIKYLKRKGKFSRMPIHLIDDLKGIEVAMGEACLSVARFSPHFLSELVQQEGTNSLVLTEI